MGLYKSKKDGIDFTDIKSYEKLIDKYDVIINCISDCNNTQKVEKIIGM